MLASLALAPGYHLPRRWRYTTSAAAVGAHTHSAAPLALHHFCPAAVGAHALCHAVGAAPLLPPPLAHTHSATPWRYTTSAAAVGAHALCHAVGATPLLPDATGAIQER